MKTFLKYAKIYATGFILSFATYVILAYCRNEGFVPFRYLFF